jgi:hypothetical protein
MTVAIEPNLSGAHAYQLAFRDEHGIISATGVHSVAEGEALAEKLLAKLNLAGLRVETGHVIP